MTTRYNASVIENGTRFECEIRIRNKIIGKTTLRATAKRFAVEMGTFVVCSRVHPIIYALVAGCIIYGRNPLIIIMATTKKQLFVPPRSVRVEGTREIDSYGKNN
jgi:hypothetical protein